MSLKKYLNQYSKEELILQITELHKKFKDVKTYYEVSMNPNENKVSENTKKIISKNISTNIPPKLKLKDARKAVTDLKKLDFSPEEIIDVMLHYVECGVDFTNAFGDIDDLFYTSIGGMYHDACELIKKNNLQLQFDNRCFKTCNKTKHIGWGFHDDLCYSYEKFIQPKK